MVFIVKTFSIEVQVDGVGDFFGSVQTLVEDIHTSTLLPQTTLLVTGLERILNDEAWQQEVKADVRVFVDLASALNQSIANNTAHIQHLTTALTKLLDTLNNSTSLPKITKQADKLLEFLTSTETQALTGKALKYFVEIQAVLVDSPYVPQIFRASKKLLEDLDATFSHEETANITKWLVPLLQHSVSITEGLASAETKSFFSTVSRLFQMIFWVILICIAIYLVIFILGMISGIILLVANVTYDGALLQPLINPTRTT